MKTLKFLCVMLTLFAACGCLFDSDKKAGRGTVVDNEVLAGKLILADGTPAINARIRVFPVNHVPDSLASGNPSTAVEFSTRTDSNGVYRLSIRQKGEFNILGDMEGRRSYLDSIYLDDSTRGIPTDTLDLPGSITGYVGLQPNHDPRTVTVQVLGTNSFSNVESGGRFTIANLAQGRYTVRILTTLSEYTPLFASFQARTGKSDSLKDTLRLPFTGIPVVMGLKATYDTLRAVARISWKPVDFRFLEEYAVYRDVESSTSLSSIPIHLTSDTVYYDSLDIPQSDTNDYTLKYRVVAVNKSGKEGDFFGSAKMAAPSFQKLRPQVRLQIRRSVWNPESGTDSVEVFATISCKTRRLAEISWDVGNGKIHPAPRKLPDGLNAADTLRFAWPYQGSYTVYTRVTDDAGTVWMDSLLASGNSAPVISGNPGTAAKANTGYAFAPAYSDPDGDRLTFRAVNLPGWATLDSMTGMIKGFPLNKDSGSDAEILLIVSDGRRKDSLPKFTLQVETNAWFKLKTRDRAESPSVLAALNGKIYAFNHYVDEYDTASDSWMVRYANIPAGLWVIGAHALGDKLLLFTSHRDSNYQVAPYLFDPVSKVWTKRANALSKRYGYSSIQYGGGYFLVGSSFSALSRQAEVELYDPALDSWSIRKETGMLPFPSGIASGDSILVLEKRMLIYQPAKDTWSNGAWPFGGNVNGKPFSVQGRVFALLQGYGIDAFWEYQPVKNQWISKSHDTTAMEACTESGGNLFCLRVGYNESSLVRFEPAFQP